MLYFLNLKLTYIYICRYIRIHIHIVYCFYTHRYIHGYIYMHTYMNTYTHTYIHTYTLTYIHTYIHTHLHTYILTYSHTYITLLYCALPYLHYIPTSIHTCMHTSIHPYIHFNIRPSHPASLCLLSIYLLCMFAYYTHTYTPWTLQVNKIITRFRDLASTSG